MSKQVDERVVSMQFDNKNFEANVQTSMSTIDKLKQKLNFSGASKGLDELNSASKKVDMTGLANGVETVRAKFSALEVMGVTALANITNSAINAGKRIVSALTIDPIKTGFQEYETQINAVQTILANTSSKGTTIDDVNKALEELNKYADKTIYNFTEMTRNIGTFTAAGIDLDTSVNAIQGIANLAAVSGSSSQQASTAMYQLSQALSSGTVKLMDWNSVVNAGMGGQVFQDALKETARVHGINIDKMIKDEGSFRETLKKNWLTSDILTETLQKFTLTTEGLTEEQIKANREMLKAKGYTEKQIDEIFKLGKTATDAATKVKTFTQLWDVLKEAAQSGWAQTWKLIVGDFEQAKSLLTPLSDALTGFINKMSDWRNKILESAFAKNFAHLKEQINGTLEPLNNLVDTVKDYNKVVKEIINGDWGNGQKRWDALTKAGYDWKHAQNLVNEELGVSLRRETDYGKTLKGSKKSTVELTKEEGKRLEALTKLSDAELKAMGYSEKQIKALKEIKKTADKLGLSVSDLVTNIDEIDGRWLFLESFKNAGKGLVKVFTALKDAWHDIFPPKSIEERAEQIFNIIAAIHKFSTKLIMSDENAEKLRRTFAGLFAIVDILTTIFGGVFKIAFKIISGLLSAFNLNILDVTAGIGDAAVKFRDWMDSILDFNKIFSFLAPYLKEAASAIREWWNELKESDKFEKFVERLRAAADAIRDFMSSLKGSGSISGFGDSISSAFEGFKDSKFYKIGSHIIEGLVNGISDGAKKVWDVISSLATGLVNKVCEILRIESPSKVFFAIGGFIVAGLIMGITSAFPEVGATMEAFASKISGFMSNIDWGAMFAAGLFATAAGIAYKIANVVESISAPLEGLDTFLTKTGKGLKKALTGIGKAFKGLGRMFTGKGIEFAGKGILNMALAVGILAASIYVLAQLETKQLITAGIAVGLLVGALILLAKQVGKMDTKEKASFAKFSLAIMAIGISILLVAKAVQMLSGIDWASGAKGILGMGLIVVGIAFLVKSISKSIKGSKNATKIGSILLQIAAALAIMALVTKMLGTMDQDEMVRGIAAIGGFMIFIVLLMAATKLIVGSKNVDVLGSTIIKISAALLLMAIVTKIMGTMDQDEMVRGILALGAFCAFIIILMAATKLIVGSKNVDAIGGTLLKISAALLLMAIVTKIMGTMNQDELIRGVAVVGAFCAFIIILMAATKLIVGSKNVDAIGGTLLKISAALLLMAIVTKIMGTMDQDEMVRGIAALGAFCAFIIFLMAATKLIVGSKNVGAIGKTLIQIAAAIAIMGITVVILGLMKTENLIKGIAAVAALALLVMGLMAVTKKAKNCKENLMMLAVVIGVMAASVVALSFIKTANLAKATIALSVLLGMFALVMKAGSNIKSSMGPLIVMTVAIAALSFALYHIAHLPADQTLAAAGAMAIALLAVAATLKIVGSMKSVSMKAIGALALITLIMAGLALILKLIDKIDGKNAIRNAVALTTMLIGMSAALVILAVVGKLGSGAFVGIAALATLIVGIGAVIVAIGALMTKFPQLEEFLDKGIPILEKIGNAIGSFLGNIVDGFLTAATDSLPEIGMKLGLFMINAQPFIMGAKKVDKKVLDGVGALAASIIALSVAEFISGITDLLSFGSSFADLGSELSEFMKNAGPFIEGIKSLDPNATTAAKNLATMILTITAANVLDGITSWLTGGNSLSDFAEDLAPFGTAMVSFGASVKELDSEAVEAATNAGTLLSNLANSLPASGGALQWFMGEKNLATFGNQLGALGTGLVAFDKAITDNGGISEEAATAAANAAKILMGLYDNLPASGGALQWFMGEKNLGNFGDQLEGFTGGLVAFDKTVTENGGISEDAATSAANAAKILMGLYENLPASGGALQWFMGEKNLGNFGNQLGPLGSGLVAFSKAVGDEQINDSAVKAAASLCSMLVNLNTNLPKTGGMVSWFEGDESFDIYISGMESLGKSLKAFASSTGEIDHDKLVSALTALNDLITYSRWIATLDTTNDVSEKIKEYGRSISNLTSIIKEFEDDCEFVNSKRFLELASGISLIASISEYEILNEGFELETIALNAVSAINQLAEVKNKNIPGVVDELIDVVTRINELGEIDVFSFIIAIQDLAGASYPDAAANLEEYANSIENSVNIIVEALINGITSSSDIELTIGSLLLRVLTGIGVFLPDFENAGSSIINSMVSGMTFGIFKMTFVIVTIITTFLGGIRNQYSNFKSAGSYLVDGFAAGITENTWKAEAKAKAMAKAAEDAARKELDINSPSKVFRAIGMSVPEGFAMGIGNMANAVKSASVGMADVALNNVKKSISRISEIVSGDIDTQPTIRPVVDLSNVRSSANLVSGLFDMNPSIGVMANARSINNMMNRNQNGANADVISAIKELKGAFDGRSGDTYNINGVTYDDGSNINDAVRTLVRAARIERRT